MSILLDFREIFRGLSSICPFGLDFLDIAVFCIEFFLSFHANQSTYDIGALNTTKTFFQATFFVIEVFNFCDGFSEIDIGGSLKSAAVHKFNEQAEKLTSRLKGEIERISGLYRFTKAETLQSNSKSPKTFKLNDKR